MRIVVNPVYVVKETTTVLRSGSFYGLALVVRSATRNINAPAVRCYYFGFRITLIKGVTR